METRASYVVIGSFVIAVIFAAFGFVYWLHHTGGLGQRAVFRVRFEQPVTGLTPGSAVLFNGVRIGEVTGLRIEPDRPQGLIASIGVDASAPMRADTTVDVDYQGLTGVAAISLKGGSASAPPLAGTDGETPILTAGEGAGQNLTQAARETLRRVDDVIGENRKSLKAAISGIGTFADMLGRNSDRIEEVLGGLERMIGGGGHPVP
jgi:phospholipid/cholesterol/gamma-HCH transport system substrate-binding protein